MKDLIAAAENGRLGGLQELRPALNIMIIMCAEF